MESALFNLLNSLPIIPLIGVLAVAMFALCKGADILVDEAVELSYRMRIPPMLIGATIVSLGTTTPEVAVSVVAAIEGKPDLALGNAVGSIICDTGLILGLGAMIRPLPLDHRVINRQGLVQIGSAFLLVILCLPFGNLGSTFTEGGNLPQWAGFLLVGLLVAYIWWTLHYSRSLAAENQVTEIAAAQASSSIFLIAAKLIGGILLVILSSKVVVPSGEILAIRAGVPPGVIAASLIAFGTSLPELVTVITSVLKGRGEIAIGNIIGADILNVFFVAGLSAAVTAEGLDASPIFFQKLFPFMIFILLTFRLGVALSKETLGRFFGFLLFALYGVFLWINYL